MDKLKRFRKQIDDLDMELLYLIKKRMRIVKKVGLYKKTKKLPVLDKKRWKKVLETRLLKARKSNLNLSFTKKLFELIHNQALKIEK
jgi:chorismate mutase